MLKITIRADQVRPGDTTVDLSTEMDFTVRAVDRAPISPLTPAEIAAVGGWVDLVGDSEDGYYQRTYEDEQSYYAAPDQMITVLRPVEVAGRPLADYTPLAVAGGAGHDHSTTTGIVGYVVRHTIDPEGVLISDGQRVGVDVAVVEGAHRYAETFPERDALRDGRGYAVVDMLYGCGCRSY